MSPDEISRQYHNLLYATRTLADVIESNNKKGKIVEEKYGPQLAKLIKSFKEVLKMLEEEKSNQGKQGARWSRKIKALCCDAELDKTLSDELKERIISGLKDLADRKSVV